MTEKREVRSGVGNIFSFLNIRRIIKPFGELSAAERAGLRDSNSTKREEKVTFVEPGFGLRILHWRLTGSGVTGSTYTGSDKIEPSEKEE